MVGAVKACFKRTPKRETRKAECSIREGAAPRRPDIPERPVYSGSEVPARRHRGRREFEEELAVRDKYYLVASQFFSI